MSRLTDPARDQALFLSHTFEFGAYRVGSHHLAREMAAMNMEVAHISTPYSLAHLILGRGEAALRKMASHGLQIDRYGVKHLVPKTLLPVQYSSSRYLLDALEEVGMPQPRFVFVDQPLMICDALFKRASTLVYRPTDLYRGGMARRLQATYTCRFDAVAATSSAVMAALPPVPGQSRVVIPNGVEFSRFDVGLNHSARSGAVYVGALDSRFDWSTVMLMAEAFPTLSIALVGPIRGIPANLPTNIELRGAVSYEDLPGILAGFAVGLLPLSASPQNAGRSPMKLFEYLASGLNVVATSIESLRSRSDLRGCFFYSDSRDSIRALSLALAAPVPNVSGVESARSQDWSGKARQLLDFSAQAYSMR